MYTDFEHAIARELTLDAAHAARSSRSTTTRSLPTAQLKKLLDSRNDREVLDGLRRVISVRFMLPPVQDHCLEALS